MDVFENILKLSKKIADSILKGKKPQDEWLETFFNEEDREYVINSLTNKGTKLKRDHLRNDINKTKKQGWEKIQKEIAPISKTYSLRFLGKIAAIFIGIISITSIYIIKTGTDPENKMESNAITLKLNNGEVIVIHPEGSEKIVNVNGQVVGTKNGTSLTYTNGIAQKNLVYNELTVPYGKKFRLQLSDGTWVHLNAGTSLKYPESFIQGKDRQVFLTGEAYFDVAEDKLHPFIVNVNDMNVKVLGTQFNISSYPEDPHINTVLVKGSVQLYDKEKPEEVSLLTPEHKATWSKTDKNISISKVDVDMYIGWIEGSMIFRGTPFKNMIKKLERNYNVSIINNNIGLNDEVFSATFHTDIESIEQVLNYISKIQPFTYTRSGNQITID